MIIRGYAVVCSGGEIHSDDERSFLFTDRDQAKNETVGLPDDDGLKPFRCGPHKVVTLRGEVSVSRRPA